MAKRASLFSTAAAGDAAPRRADLAPAPVRSEAMPSTIRPPSREGKRVFSVYLTPEALKQLRLLSLDSGKSGQELGQEAVNLLFEKHRLNRIA